MDMDSLNYSIVSTFHMTDKAAKFPQLFCLSPLTF